MTYNPHWPFPQYDHAGKLLLPEGWLRKQHPIKDVIDLGEAKW